MPTSFAFHDITIIALDDGEGPFFEPREDAFPGASPAQWERADREDPGSVRDGAWWLRFRSYAVRLPSGQLVIIDAGIGSASAPARAWAPVPGRLPEELAAAGVAVDEVDIVVLTHMHTDHVGWSMDDRGDVFFPRARYLLQRAEIEAIDARSRALAEWLLAPLRITGQLSPVDGEESLGDGLRCVATPGHTPGHQSVLLEVGSETLAFAGDLLVHMVQLLNPELGYTHEDDQDQARVTRTALLAGLGQRSRTILAAPHLSEPFLDPRQGVIRPG
jgi:glyoxylase-like metal-dependent hydrolase (beta-lactamase superfamily II)